MNSVKNTPRWFALIIAVLAIIVYLPVRQAGFLWDDDLLITESRLIHAPDGLYRFWLTTEARDYYPLTSSLWWLEWRWWGTNPAGYHLLNVLLHAVCAVFVWTTVRQLKIPGAWLAGLIFAVHPVNVATVAWISEQKNLLSMFFFIGAIWLYLRFYERENWKWYLLSLAAFLLALLSKSAVVMQPIVLLLCVWWLRGRVRWSDFAYTVPFFCLSLVLGLATIWFQTHRVLEGEIVHSAGFAARLAGAGWVPWFYLWKALVPVDLMVIYPKWEIDAGQWTSYLPGLVLLACFAVFWSKRASWGRPLFFALGYFVVMLFPVMGFIDQHFYRLSLVADHWQYYSIIAPIAFMAAAGTAICAHWGEPGRIWCRGVALFVLALLGAATWSRAVIYANAETLWRDNAMKNPAAYVAHHNLGVVLAQNGKLTEAITEFEQTLRLKPDFAEAHYNLGSALAQRGKLPAAIEQFEQLIRLKPDDAGAQNNLANALAMAGRPSDALVHYAQAARLAPDSAGVLFNWANALEQAGKTDEAVDRYRQALQLKPDFVPAQKALQRLRAAP